MWIWDIRQSLVNTSLWLRFMISDLVQEILSGSPAILVVPLIQHVLGRICIIRCRYGGMILQYTLIQRIISTVFWMMTESRQTHVIKDCKP